MKRLLAVPAAALWLVIAALVALVAYNALRPAPKPILPPKVAHTSDSLIATRAAYEARQDSLRRVALAARNAGAAAERRAKVAEDSAARQRVRADSLAGLGDTVAAYKARTLEADSLRSGTASLHVSLDSAKASGLRWESKFYIADDRLRTSEENARQMRAAIAKAEKRCRFCPTRTQAAIGGFVVGVAATVAVTQR